MAISSVTRAISLTAPDCKDPDALSRWISRELLPVLDRLRTSMNQVAAMTADPAVDSNVGLLLTVDDAGTLSVQQVSVGAADSMGAGFRGLRIPNA